MVKTALSLNILPYFLHSLVSHQYKLPMLSNLCAHKKGFPTLLMVIKFITSTNSLVYKKNSISSKLLGASVRTSTHGKGHEEGGSTYDIRKGGIEPQESPWKFSSIYPHNQSLPTLLLCALTYTSDFMRGLSPTTSFGEGVNLELQLIKTPGMF